MNYYCTLFDSNYLTRGLAMYQSILDTGEKFQLYIVCFDEIAFEILQKLTLENMIIVSLQEFENEDLLRVKQTRTRGEYCWTCTSYVIRYVMDTFELPEATYLDADLYFFQKPSILLNEFRNSNKDVMITEHRYTPEYDQTEKSGIYCVQFMSFKGNTNGRKVLQWWQDQCLEWCFARFENGKFGDQKYLDDWLVRFDCIHVLDHLGGGVAPWNIQQYRITHGPKVNDIDVIFYHFHNLKWFSIDKFDLGLYKVQYKVISLVYFPYFHSLRHALNIVQEYWDKDFMRGIEREKWHWKSPFRKMKRKWKGTYNVVQG